MCHKNAQYQQFKAQCDGHRFFMRSPSSMLCCGDSQYDCTSYFMDKLYHKFVTHNWLNTLPKRSIKTFINVQRLDKYWRKKIIKWFLFANQASDNTLCEIITFAHDTAPVSMCTVDIHTMLGVARQNASIWRAIIKAGKKCSSCP